MRSDGRLPEQLRPTRITPNYLIHAEGLCPRRGGQDQGHLHRQHRRPRAAVSPQHRQRLGHRGIRHAAARDDARGRSGKRRRAGSAGARRKSSGSSAVRCARSRSSRRLGERTITLDCDVIQADGGTRTASISGAFVALVLALNKLREQDVLRTMPVTDYVAATSVGIVEGEPMLDLAYTEDSRADVDMNVVKTGGGLYIELQGTAEALPFGREALNRLLDLADTGTRQLFALQRGLVGQYLGK